MELASQVLLGILGLIVFVFVAGLVAIWWEQRKREKGGKVNNY